MVNSVYYMMPANPPGKQREEKMSARLIEPDGTIGIITSVSDAVAYCKTHPGWSWQDVGDYYGPTGPNIDWEEPKNFSLRKSSRGKQR